MNPPKTNPEDILARLSVLEEQMLDVQSKQDGPSLEPADLAFRLRNFEQQFLGTRVQIRNLEGAFKVVSKVPDTTSGWLNGSIVLYDDGTNRRLYAYMNGVWRVVTLT